MTKLEQKAMLRRTRWRRAGASGEIDEVDRGPARRQIVKQEKLQRFRFREAADDIDDDDDTWFDDVLLPIKKSLRP